MRLLRLGRSKAARSSTFRASARRRSIRRSRRNSRRSPRNLVVDGTRGREGEVFFDLEIAARVWRVVSRSGVAWLMRENPDLREPSRRLRARHGGRREDGDRRRVFRRARGCVARSDAVSQNCFRAPIWSSRRPPRRCPGPPRRPIRIASTASRPARATMRFLRAGSISPAFPRSACRSAYRAPACRSARNSSPASAPTTQLLAFAREISAAAPPPPLPQLEAIS